MERELYNLKTKILRDKHISDQLREELANDVFEIEKLVNKTNDIHDVSQLSELLIDYMKWFDDNRDMYYEVSNKEMIDEYIKSINCG